MLRLACIENPYFHRDSGRRSSDFCLQSVGLQSVQYVFAPRDNGHCRWTVFDRRISLGREIIDPPGVADPFVSVEQLLCKNQRSATVRLCGVKIRSISRCRLRRSTVSLRRRNRFTSGPIFPSRRSTGTNGGYGLKAKSKRRLKQITAS